MNDQLDVDELAVYLRSWMKHSLVGDGEEGVVQAEVPVYVYLVQLGKYHYFWNL